MKQVVKVGILRSLNRTLKELMQKLEWRAKYKPGTGTVEMGHLLGLQDGATAIEKEIQRITRLKVQKKSQGIILNS